MAELTLSHIKNVIMNTFRSIERAVALLLANLIPGIGGRFVQPRETESEDVKENEHGREEERRTTEEAATADTAESSTTSTPPNQAASIVKASSPTCIEESNVQSEHSTTLDEDQGLATPSSIRARVATTAVSSTVFDDSKVHTEPLHILKAGVEPSDDLDTRNMAEPTGLNDNNEDDEDDAGSDAQSESSSVVYIDQEPFETFQHKVMALTLSRIWPDASADDIVVERLRGGSYNRIIGLTRQFRDHCGNNVQYILRTPRSSCTDMERDVATLRFLQQHSTIAIPNVVMFDSTKNNELEARYMIQERVKGADAYSCWDELDHKALCRLAKEVGDTYRQMLSMRSTKTGVFSFPPEDKSLDAASQVMPFRYNAGMPGGPYDAFTASQSVLELLTTSFQGYKAACMERDPEDILTPAISADLRTIATELDVEGWLADMPNCLAHLDLAPRNIIINPEHESKSSIISSVLDWDSAILAPMFASCTPPFWLWSSDDEDREERTANDPPVTPELREVKHLFEEAAGQDYMQYAYQPAYRLARRLLYFAIEGVTCSWEIEEIKDIFQEWTTIRDPRTGDSKSAIVTLDEELAPYESVETVVEEDEHEQSP